MGPAALSRNAAAVVRDGAGAPWLHCWLAGGDWGDGARARRVALRVAADRPALDGPSTTGPHLQLLDLRYIASKALHVAHHSDEHVPGVINTCTELWARARSYDHVHGVMNACTELFCCSAL